MIREAHDVVNLCFFFFCCLFGKIESIFFFPTDHFGLYVFRTHLFDVVVGVVGVVVVGVQCAFQIKCSNYRNVVVILYIALACALTPLLWF